MCLSKILKPTVEMEGMVTFKQFWVEKEKIRSLYYGREEFSIGTVRIEERGKTIGDLRYDSGFHSWFKASPFERVFIGNKNSFRFVQVGLPVMIADVIAHDGEQVVARVEMTLTEEDYELYLKDISTDPITLEEECFTIAESVA